MALSLNEAFVLALIVVKITLIVVKIIVIVRTNCTYTCHCGGRICCSIAHIRRRRFNVQHITDVEMGDPMIADDGRTAENDGSNTADVV